MKILILHPPLYPINHTVFNELGKEIDLLVISFGKEPEFNKWDIKKEKKFNYKLLFIDKKHSIKWIKKLIEFKPDIVISIAFWLPSLIASLASPYLRYKFLVLTDAIYSTDKNISKFKLFTRRTICALSNGVISASKKTTEYIKYLCPKTKIYESYHVINFDKWIEDLDKLPKKYELREAMGFHKDKIIFLGVGNFIEKKNWESVFENIKDIDNVIFILIGGGKLKDNYRKIIYDSKLNDKVFIFDRKNGMELKKYYKIADIFIFPTLSDQFGYVVLEALASNLPVLCSKYCGASSIVKNEYNGLIIDPRKSYKKEITNIIMNVQKYAMFARSSVSRFTVDNKVKEMLDIFEKIL